MKNDLSCEVVLDLLPSYADGLTSMITNQALEQHTAGCQSCKEVYERMRQKDQVAEAVEKKEIDFLKKTRTRQRNRVLLVAILTMIVVSAAFLVQTFCIGKEVSDADLISADVTVVDRQRIEISGNLLDAQKGVADIKFENVDGVVNITFWETEKKSSFHSNEFYEEYISESTITQVKVEDRVIWDQGIQITKEVALLYESRHSYIGEMSANTTTAEALQLSDRIGSYTSELQTTEEPYGWIIIVDEAYDTEDVTRITEEMAACGAAMIAVIDNLSYVTFEYADINGPGKITVTQQYADVQAARPAKEMAQTPGGLQSYMKMLGLSNISK